MEGQCRPLSRPISSQHGVGDQDWICKETPSRLCEHRWREELGLGGLSGIGVRKGKVGAMQNLLAQVAGVSSHDGGIFSKRPQQRTSLEVLQRILEHRGKDNETLTVVEMSAEHRKAQQAHMNRHMLLQECHKDVKQFNPHARKLSLSR